MKSFEVRLRAAFPVRFGSILFLACCLQTVCAVAQEPAAVERAVLDGDFSEARRLASSAIARGGRTRAELTILYRALAVAQARLGEVEEAQRSFVSLLAFDPAFKLDAEAPVEVRSPYMEARGFWSLHPEPLAASAELSEDASTLWVSLHDPAGLTSRILVHLRFQGQTRYVEQVLTPSEGLAVNLQGLGAATAAVEYTLALLDPNANRIWELGSDADPQRLSVLHSAQTASGGRDPAPLTPATAQTTGDGAARAYRWGGIAALMLGVGATALGGYAHYERQQYAARWNEGDCHGAGITRGSLCRSERHHLTQFEHWALGAYVAGGAALITGSLLLLLAPERRRTHAVETSPSTSVRCIEGPGLIGVACRKSF